MTSSREFSYRWTWELSASPEALWPLVSDTNRFNRDAGLPPVEDARRPGERLPNARRKLRLRVKGILLEWEELPFEWHRPYRFGVVRRYSRGPLQEMRVLATLEPSGSGSRLEYRVAARPRGLLGALTTPIQIGLVSRWQFGRVFRAYAEAAARDPESEIPAPRLSARVVARIRHARGRLLDAGVPQELAERLVSHVAEADDLTLARIRPYALADRWGSDRRGVLDGCLRATRAGVLDLHWDILCPICKGAQDGADTLRRLRTGVAHCETCQIDFSPDFDQSVEVSFRPAEALRTVHAPPFCVAGPQITPHVEVQQLLDAGERRVVDARLTEGRHRARAFGVSGGPSFVVAPAGAPEATLALSAEESWTGPAGPVAPQVRLTLVNDTAETVLFDVERTSWGDSAATAAEVTAMAGFRDLFSSEVLAAGDFMSVGSLAILFTDLRGSTGLYHRVGDAPAFTRVMRHFDVLHEAVTEADGAVVKTIGDAVMAVFRTPAPALSAVFAAQDRLAAMTGTETPDALVLKAGLHYGPCIAVTLNDRLDYFGTTVNVAARLGALAGGGDVVISDGVQHDPEVQHALEEGAVRMTSGTADIQGLSEHFRYWRVSRGAPRESAPGSQAGGE